MSERLPVHVDPLTLADRGRALSGAVPVSACQRLSHWLESEEGEFAVELQFGRDENQRRVLTGRVRGRVMLTCQRCLGAFGLDIDLPIGVVLVDSEAEAETLPEEVDALVVGDGATMHTVDMIEDDLILALPLIAKCPDSSACEPAVEIFDSERMTGQEAGTRRPFADIDDPGDADDK
ncbi:MAG: YceD family protein [Halofilum sp. (in: g-proteobacteria)]